MQIKSSGDLENNDEIAKLALKIAYTAAKVPVNPDTKDSFKRISSKINLKINLIKISLIIFFQVVIENQYVFMMTIHHRKIYLVKRLHVAEDNNN